MIVRSLKDIVDSDREVNAPTFTSRRLLLKKDKLGFSFHDTILFAGTETPIWYKHHLEAVYCISGHGEVRLLPDGPTYPIDPGTLYALDGHEKHILKAITELRMMCVFSPPLTGKEIHDQDGSYPLADDEPSAR